MTEGQLRSAPASQKRSVESAFDQQRQDGTATAS